MAPVPLRVLIIEDSEDDALLLLRELRRAGYDPSSQRVQTKAELEEALQQRWELILSDYTLPQFGALEALHVLQEKGQDLPFIAVSGTVTETTILAAIKAGAGDYLMKDNLTRLGAAVDRELREAMGRRERRRLEEQLRHAQKMEAVGRLAGGVAHDFNNLLTVITGYSDLLLAGQDLAPAQRTALEEIRKASERGGALTHQLLAFSRRQPLTPKVVRPNELVANMEKMLRRLIGEDVQLTTIPATTGTIKTDPGQLEQVIMNLVVNARDAMPQGGKLTIETGDFLLDDPFTATSLDLKPGAYVMLAISDTGIGMDAETRSHLFEPFFTTKAPGRGTGLGLATAYGIIRQSGGSILVYSEPGHGTTLKIYLPRVPDHNGGEQPAQTPEADIAGSETILVVEDEDRVRKLICEVLLAKGYRVLEAIRGEEAVAICKGHAGAIDLVVVDVVMPQMSGPDVVRQLQEARPSLKVLYMSGYTDEAIMQHGILASGSAFLQKPFMPNTLARKVREVLNAQNSSAENGKH
jgi:signal transduction histidine kinase